MGIGVRAVAVSGNSLMNRPRGPSGKCRMEVGLGTMQFRQALNFKGGDAIFRSRLRELVVKI